jgi:putative membrane protein
MKTYTHITAALFQSGLIAATLLGMLSCSNETKTEDTKDIAETINEVKYENSNKEKVDEAQFLVDAAEINLEEIQLGKLAQKNSKIPGIISFGKMMEDAHTKSLNQLTALAKKKSISIPIAPTEESKKEYSKLSTKTGNEFDTEFSDKMVRGHKDAIKLFEKASEGSEDADIRKWAIETLPELRKHLEHAEAIEKNSKSLN